ncbi:MAG: 2-hydroxyacid dehydrogenase [Terracidiphilus sp.]|jgi:phosphoglycerate dehydrogenase-like enzyme
MASASIEPGKKGLRVGYPATLAAELLRGFPPECALIAVSDSPGPEIDIDVWIPDPYPTRAMRTWPRLRGVRLVLSLMAGTEWIPRTVGPHVTICNARGAHNISTAEWTISSILAMLKYFPFYLDVQRSGQWKRRFEASAHYASVTGDTRPLYPPVMLEELTGKTVLLVGYGSIGRDIERMLAPFNVDLLRVARTARIDPEVYAVSELDNLLTRAQVVILILPATAESNKLIGAEQLALMPQGALLVNAARGPIVDTDALVAALNAGRIRAALDVTDPEPLPAGHPLWNCPNLLLTPHVGGSSPQFAVRALRIAAEELRRYIAGEPLHNVVQAAI